MTRRRPLSEEEHHLWNRVTRHVTPMKPKPVSVAPRIEKTPVIHAKPQMQLAPRLPHQHTATTHQSHDPFSAGDPAMERRASRGRAEIDARLDLHGHTQTSAHNALRRFIEQRRARGDRCLLVITGKGVAGQGVLRERVRAWISEPDLRAHIARAAEAHQRHGGAGAVYLFLRRPSR